MADDVDPEVIKRTQTLLQPYFQKPPLTEKLLRKPPFRFLHDIVTAVIRETDFLKGLFSKDELVSENIKDKEAKVKFLTKLIKVMGLVHGKPLQVKPSKIVAGLEPARTNELLQSIGLALKKQLKSDKAIEEYKKGSTQSQSRTSDDASKTATPKKMARSDSRPSRESVRKKPSVTNGDSETPKKEKKREPPKVKVSPSREKPKKQPEENGHHDSNLRPPKEDKKLKSSRNPSLSRLKEDSKSFSSTENEPRENGTPVRQPVIGPPPKESRPPTSTRKSHQMSKESSSEVSSTDMGLTISSSMKPKRPDSTRASSALRPASGRPSSARPAAPRLHLSQESTISETSQAAIEETAPSVFQEADSKFDEDDEANDMVVVKNQMDSYGSTIQQQPVANLDQEHGHLVAQILETQKELINTTEVNLIPQEIETRRPDKPSSETTIKEVEKLRKSIQQLTKSSNPLGKLLDFLQENVEVMRKEAQDWRKQNERYELELEQKKKLAEKSTEPIKQSLGKIDESIKLELERIHQCKLNISKNSEKIRKSINGIT